MTVAQARAVLPGFDVSKEAMSGGCDYASGGGLPAGLGVMIEDGIVVRIEVDTSSIPTAEGARVGDSEAKVRSIYGSRLTASPNKYTDEPDLTVRSAAPADSTHEIIFETLKGKVIRYRAGKLPQVRYVEGCA